jgi:predicted site-specific integrase-resolvase
MIRLDTGADMSTYRLSAAAKLIGVAPITLKRWLLSRRVDEVHRDRNGWRVFTVDDVTRIKAYASTLRPPSEAKVASSVRP